MSISSMFEIGKRSLMAYQSAINTTSENISNVNTEGYVRRRPDLSDLTIGMAGIGRVGIGVSADDISRIRQSFVDQQLWYENQDLGKYGSDEMVLSQIEQIFGESTDAGLSTVLNQFWGAWNDLGNDPESQSARTLVRDKGELLASTFNQIDTNFKNMQEQIGNDIQTKVKTINQILNQISDINKQFKTADAPGLLDERDRLITQLSQLVNIDVREKDNGNVTISSGGIILVSDNEVNEFTAELKQNDGNYQAIIKYKNVDREADITSGELASLTDTLNKRIPDYMSKLDELARNIASRVNEVHKGGYNLSGITGISFFADDVTGAGNFRLNSAVSKDPSLIATRTSTSASGDGSIARDVFDLQYESFVQGSTTSDFYTALLTQVGNELKTSQSSKESGQLIVQHLQNQKDSISGVSLDEEMTNLIQYQQAYEAAGKVVKTVDEMVQTLLNIV